MKSLLLKFWKDEEGATAIEYALIAGIIAVAVIAAFTALGGSLKTFFADIGSGLEKAGGTIKTDLENVGTTPPTDP